MRSGTTEGAVVTNQTVLVATWSDGLFIVTAEKRGPELAGQPVRGLAHDGHGGAIAIVGGHALRRRTADGEWTTVATSQVELSCCLAVGDAIYAGTEDARILRVNKRGQFDPLAGFDNVAGRDTWYAGSAIVNGQRVGPPLGIRSVTATPAGVLLVNVHVGGIVRSSDGGITWQPTIDITADVHQVCAHPTDPRMAAAASGVGLCISRDAGATWTIEQEGLHGLHCSAVAFSGGDVLVSAAENHFAAHGAIYRRPMETRGVLAPVGHGFPRWVDGITDTDCIASKASTIAVVDQAGNLFLSGNSGRAWSGEVKGLPMPSSVLIS
jgi:photosystem II stability/assembly factor-like uncharacterized protein